MKFVFRILKDQLRPNQEPVFLPRGPRSLLVLEGDLTVEHETGNQHLGSDTGWVGEEQIAYLAGTQGATLIRWELVSANGDGQSGKLLSAPKATSEVLLNTEIELDPAFEWLLRCDLVTFPAGTEAPWHMHQGPGLRYLLAGELDAIGPGGVHKIHKPGDAFLENGVDEAVRAGMSKTEATSFARGLLLPRALKSRGSTRLVKPDDWGTSKGQTYHVYCERFIDLPS